MSHFTFHSLDISIIAIYFIAVFIVGYFASKGTSSGEDLFLAGRSLGWIPIGFSLFASNISSTTLIGLTGQAYQSGLSVSNYEWMAALVLVFMSLFVIPLYIKNKISTIPEFLGRRFDHRSQKYFSLITIFLNIAVDTAGGLYAGALVIKLIFPSAEIWQLCFVLAFITGIYTASGGLKAVVYTDVIQTIVLLIGCCCLTFTLFSHFQFSWNKAFAGIPDGFLSVIKPLNDPVLPWLGTVVGVPILGFYYWSTNQYIVQRVLGARNLSHARWGAMLGGLLKIPVLLFMVLPGVMAINLFPNISNPDLVFPRIVTEILPVGVVGLILSALIAAIMSSIDSTLNSASTLIVLDFIKPKQKNLTDRQIRNIGRWTTIVLMIVAALWAPQIQKFSGLFSYLQQAFSYVVPPVVAIFIVGIFWSRPNGNASLATLITGHILCFVFFILSQMQIIHLHFTVMAGLLTFLCIGIFFAYTFSENQMTLSKDVSDFVWKKDDLQPAKKYAFYLDYRYHCALLCLLTLMLVVIFW